MTVEFSYQGSPGWISFLEEEEVDPWMVCQLKSYFATSTTIDISLEMCSSLGKQNNMWFASSFTKALSLEASGPSGRLVFISAVSVSETVTGDRVAIVAPESLLRGGTVGEREDYRSTGILCGRVVRGSDSEMYPILSSSDVIHIRRG